MASGSTLKDKIIGKTAKFMREFNRLEPFLLNAEQKCLICGSAKDELHDIGCPLYTLEGMRMDLNKLFYNIRTAEEAAENPKAL